MSPEGHHGAANLRPQRGTLKISTSIAAGPKSNDSKEIGGVALRSYRRTEGLYWER